MPLRRGTSNKTVSKNIAELHGGKTHARTQRKYGKAKANAQSIAIALDKKRESARKKAKKTARKKSKKIAKRGKS